MKFGGTSVKDVERIESVADKVMREIENGYDVCVVVSAMAGMTNQLVEYCSQINETHTGADYDTVLAAGEQITAGLLALALQKRGRDARSWLGWQVPISCSDAYGKSRIENIPSDKFQNAMSAGQVAVVAGFQGVSADNRITTLGRGGSDTTAVALASALGAGRCDIYTDVDGLYSADPRIAPMARKIEKACFEEVLEMASLGAKVLHARSVELAFKENVMVQVLSSFGDAIGSDLLGTIITSEDKTMEHASVNGVAHSMDEAQITLYNVTDVPGVIANIMQPLAEADIIIDTIVQSASVDGKTSITFSLPEADLKRGQAALNNAGFNDLIVDSDVAKVSAVGMGMRSQTGVAATFFDALAGANINIKAVSTSDIKISVLINRKQAQQAVQALHSAYHLDKNHKLV